MITIAFTLLFFVIRIYTYVVIGAVIFSLLGSFGVLDMRNRTVWSIGDFLNRATEPLLNPIRRVLPNFGAIDLSPMILLALIQLAILPILERLYEAIATGRWLSLIV